jgi:hypothetical protein
MSDALPTGRRNPQPGRAKDNSPRIHPWVADRIGNKSRQGRKRMSGFRLKRCLFRGAPAFSYSALDRDTGENRPHFRTT